MQRIANRQQDPSYDYLAIAPLTPDQLADMVRFRDLPLNVRLDPEAPPPPLTPAPNPYTKGFQEFDIVARK